MKIHSLENLLESNTYPGRGILIGRSDDGRNAVIIYFIMGRSENSRNRIFVETKDGIRTEAFDPAKLVDPSLIIYSPVRVFGETTIVTNGDQTDTIYEGLEKGLTFEQSLRSRSFEPDAPNYTPRISGIVKLLKNDFCYELSILKSHYQDPSSCDRFTYTYDDPRPGEGSFIHTYMGDGKPLPSFEGEPERVAVTGDIDDFGQRVWQSLNHDNKVSAFIRYIDLETGKPDTRLYNKLA